jgi:NADP-dependent aldehyde dehydrogenase
VELRGTSLVAGEWTSGGERRFAVSDRTGGEPLLPEFSESTATEVDAAARAAAQAFDVYRKTTPVQRAIFLEAIADELLKLGDALIKRAMAETALPEARLTGERGRTIGQLKMFADLLREGSWVEARIDRAQADRKPLPKPDLRRMLVPLGPVAVFGASNFPLAFSVPGGDTASALAAGCPVVVKAHPAHPGTSELCAEAIAAAAQATGIPAGVFSMVHGTGPEVGMELVRHPAIKAVGFTGSLRAGRAIFDAATARPEPIPVYAEMGSTNPVFLLPGALAARGAQIAEQFVQSVTLGVGQFCTNPGLAFGLRDGGLDQFAAATAEHAKASAAGTMLYDQVCSRWYEGVQHLRGLAGVEVLGERTASDVDVGKAGALVFATDAQTFVKEPALQEEVFGPSSVVVSCASWDEMLDIARNLPGQLTATVHATEDDLGNHRELIDMLTQKVGRLVINGFPTGVEVCASMQHGGPYPATTDSRTTSVGTDAIKRFVRPVCWQGFPDELLPVELQNANARGIWRLVDGEFTKADIG